MAASIHCIQVLISCDLSHLPRLDISKNREGHFLGYIQWWWYFRPSLLREGALAHPIHSMYPLHSSYVAPSAVSTAKLARYSYLYSPTLSLSTSLFNSTQIHSNYVLIRPSSLQSRMVSNVSTLVSPCRLSEHDCSILWCIIALSPPSPPHTQRKIIE
jgi:hypothetical protein